METTQESVQPQTSEVSPKAMEIVAGHFSGMLGSFQLNAFNTMIACEVSRRIAHKIATDYGSDIGRMMRTSDELSSKVAKANKLGESKLSIKGSGKLLTTYSMSFVRVCQQMHELHKEGLIATKELPELSKDLRIYAEESEAWTLTQTWKD